MTPRHLDGPTADLVQPETLPSPLAPVGTSDGGFVPLCWWTMGEDSLWLDAKRVTASQGLYVTQRAMLDELDEDHPLALRQLDGQNVIADWQPAPPGPEWTMLLAKVDTEEGPVAAWARPLTQADRDSDPDLQPWIALLPVGTKVLAAHREWLELRLPSTDVATRIARRLRGA